jgi:hypothetical protein
MSEPNWKVIGRHREPPEAARRSRLSWLFTAVLVGLTLVAGSAIIKIKPDSDRLVRPYIIAGKLRQPVDARTLDVTVLDTTGGTQLVHNGATLDTAGLWIVVRVKAVAHEKPLEIQYAALVDGTGRAFDPTERFTQPLVFGRTLEPGIPVEGQIAFETPVSAANHLSLRLSDQSKVGAFGLDLSAIASVPLGVTAAQAQSWVGAKNKVTIDAAQAVQ